MPQAGAAGCCRRAGARMKWDEPCEPGWRDARQRHCPAAFQFWPSPLHASSFTPGHGLLAGSGDNSSAGVEFQFWF